MLTLYLQYLSSATVDGSGADASWKEPTTSRATKLSLLFCLIVQMKTCWHCIPCICPPQQSMELALILPEGCKQLVEPHKVVSLVCPIDLKFDPVSLSFLSLFGMIVGTESSRVSSSWHKPIAFFEYSKKYYNLWLKTSDKKATHKNKIINLRVNVCRTCCRSWCLWAKNLETIPTQPSSWEKIDTTWKHKLYLVRYQS